MAGAEGLEPNRPAVLETAALPAELYPYMIPRWAVFAFLRNFLLAAPTAPSVWPLTGRLAGHAESRHPSGKWRGEWDSNPRRLAPLRFSKPAHSTTMRPPRIAHRTCGGTDDQTILFSTKIPISSSGGVDGFNPHRHHPIPKLGQRPRSSPPGMGETCASTSQIPRRSHLECEGTAEIWSAGKGSFPEPKP